MSNHSVIMHLLINGMYLVLLHNIDIINGVRLYGSLIQSRPDLRKGRDREDEEYLTTTLSTKTRI